MNSITLTGWKEFADKAARLPKVLLREIDGECEDGARQWATLAKQDAPKDQGFLVGQISSLKVAQGHYETVSPAEYSAYVEWGTKTRVRVPAELQSYAAEFRGGKGQGNAKRMIFAWMNRVGVPKDKQWIVFYSIITKGIRPHPYFFPQKPIVEKSLIQNLKAIINTEH